MVTKTISLTLVGLLLLTPVAFAQTPGSATTTPPSATAKIACVGAAVNAREAAIDSAMTTYTGALNAAYGARAAALKTAYTLTTLKDVRAAVKVAWSDFSKAMRSAQGAWKTSRMGAWTAYRQAAVACKAPSGTGDGANSVSEASGN